MGSVVTKPGIVTSVVETAECLLDQRHLEADKLASMLDAAQDAGAEFAHRRNVDVDWERIWQIEPILFDEQLIELAGRSHQGGRRHLAACRRAAPRRRRGLAAGHPDGDALRPEPARALAHEARGHEEEHIELSVRALDGLADRAIAGLS